MRMFIICLICSIYPLSLAIAATDNPSWFEHVDLMELLIGLLFAGFIWFATRTLNKIDTNQGIMFTRLSVIEKDFYELRGEHKAVSSHSHHRETD